MASGKTVTISRAELLDRIRGAWTAKSYGVCYGAPTEFKYKGEMIEGPLKMEDRGLQTLPRQDDLYIDMVFLKAMADYGLDAPASALAKNFMSAPFELWHSGMQGRQNLLAGVPPEKSGRPEFTPHAEDIGFSIASDFIGLISPGLPQSARKIADRVGHMTAYGDGFYGGVFVSSLYTAALVENDIIRVIESALNQIPADTGYARAIRDVLKWHKQHPEDWKATWREMQNAYGATDRCPWGVAVDDKDKLNISARLNNGYTVMALLYGRGDVEKTIEIATRAGQDSDCNPSTVGGVLGAMQGYNRLPQNVKTAIAPYMETKFSYTPYTIESASTECVRLAIANVKANGGKEAGDRIDIKMQPFKSTGPTEVAFTNLVPADRFMVNDNRLVWKGSWTPAPDLKGSRITESFRYSEQAGDYMEVEFTGSAVYVQGESSSRYGIVAAFVDGKPAQTQDMYLPKTWKQAGNTKAVWLTGLPDGKHTLQVRVTGQKNPNSEGVRIGLGKIVTYRGRIGK